MIGREDFIATIGYEGNVAIVDKSLKKRYGGLSTQELAEKGLFKPALCSALYNKSKEEFELVVKTYNQNTARKVQSVEDLKRIIGVNAVPSEVEKVTSI